MHFWSNLIAWGYQRTLPLYHAFVIDMVLANGAEIPAPSEVSMFAKANIELRARRGGDGDFSSTAGPQARRPRPSAKISKSRCLLKQTAISERNLRMAGGAKFQSKERSDVVRK